MASLLEIKKKIGAVQNTKKITKAMQLVAASKMRTFQKKALATRSYVYSLLDMVAEHLESGEEKNVYTLPRTKGKVLFILYTSDKGLCGGLNSQLMRALFKSEKWLSTPAEERLLITIGRKSYDFARANGIPVEKHFIGISEQLTTLEALKVLDDILTYWDQELCREVIFAVPYYKNSFTFYTKLKTFLPFTPEAIREYKHVEQEAEIVKDRGDLTLFEPTKEKVMESLYGLVVESLFIQSFFELKACEYSSRMIAMQNATDAAQRVVGELTLSYNKTRQQVITQQLAEIVGAGEAIS